MTPAQRPALTARGRGLLAAAGALLVTAWLFGSAELAGLGAAAAAAVGAAAVVVRRAPATYRAERWLAPARVGVGATASARLRFTNVGSRPTAGTAVATDGLGNGSARCRVPALGPGAVAEAAYELPTERRGVIAVGPLAIGFGDPLGLAERRVEVTGAGRLVVHPRIHPVLALPGSSTREARHGSTHPARAPQGDDFFALREYEMGDDLRRVHWRSTARLGELMLRQDELRFGEVATVLLDTRARAHRGDSFERALEVAASVAAALVDDGRRLRFLTTAGFEVELDRVLAGAPGGRGGGKWAAILEHLAVVTPHGARGMGGVPPTRAAGAANARGMGGVPPTRAAGAAKDSADRFALALQSIRRHPSGPLAAVVGDPAPADLAALGALRSRLGLVVIAHCRSGGAALEGGSPHPAAGAVVVSVGDTKEFPQAWNQAVLSCSRRDVVRT
ncbi:MAG TPA: DUF58 domain-containing protein [Acidimicrobiia bacterium]|nr:DUF58 domain-containing protein [Acidimicrobiia bacterium]